MVGFLPERSVGAWILSVLALSSRFDGHDEGHRCADAHPTFQYSLCRVVLMVKSYFTWHAGYMIFQYSLCRVVLMVTLRIARGFAKFFLSVLALSSRFDGRLVL